MDVAHFPKGRTEPLDSALNKNFKGIVMESGSWHCVANPPQNKAEKKLFQFFEEGWRSLRYLLVQGPLTNLSWFLNRNPSNVSEKTKWHHRYHCFGVWHWGVKQMPVLSFQVLAYYPVARKFKLVDYDASSASKVESENMV